MMGREKEWDETKADKRKWKEIIGDEMKGLKTKINGNETEWRDMRKMDVNGRKGMEMRGYEWKWKEMTENEWNDETKRYAKK